MSLSRSQRVTAIQEIASKLASEDFDVIDMIFRQFSLPTPSYSGDRRGYILQVLGEASDERLSELREHLGLQQMAPVLDNAAPRVALPCWVGDDLRVFVSHLSAERELAANIQTALKPHGFSCFVAHNDIHPTREWQIEIENALVSCELLVALIHPGFHASQWCDQEIGYALGRGIPVFTIRYGEDPHGFVSRFQAFSGSGKTPRDTAAELSKAALQHDKLYDHVARMLLSAFERSGSYATSKARIADLESLRTWNPEFSDRLRSAVKNNDQISGSWGVPQQVERLLAKWQS